MKGQLSLTEAIVQLQFLNAVGEIRHNINHLSLCFLSAVIVIQPINNKHTIIPGIAQICIIKSSWLSITLERNPLYPDVALSAKL